MAWETRQNGRRYFYLSQRRHDGSVGRKYFGYGLRAHVESLRLELKAAQKLRDSQLRQLFRDLDSVAADHARAAHSLCEATLIAAGFHNSGSRGWRKRRSFQMIKRAECERQPEAAPMDESGEIVTEEVSLEQVIRRCRQGDRDALVTLRQAMQDYPDCFGDQDRVTAMIQKEWIAALAGSDLYSKELIIRNTVQLRDGLIAEGSGTHLERLMIDQVVTGHLEQGFHALITARCVTKGQELPSFHLDASQRAHRRHEKALAALTTIRTLAPKMATVRPEAETVVEDRPTEEHPPQYAPAETNRVTAVFERMRRAVIQH